MWHIGDAEIHLPRPLFVVVEDVGWWKGEDGSSRNEPYRNSFCRNHCLEDYKALLRLAKHLRMRIALGMVLGEWDRTDFLRDIPGATWMGANWDNSANRGRQLDQAAAFLRDNSSFLEIALHGLCHEFWRNGRMERSEFHDSDCRMRSPLVVRSHLQAFGTLLEQNDLGAYPRLFIPPGLFHSFGNGDESMQAILHDFGVDLVTTRFSRARQYAPPHHSTLTWENGVGLLERGMSPVAWDVASAIPVWNNPGPIMALHWGNLLHLDPLRNGEVVDGWVRMLQQETAGPDRIPSGDAANCWRQTTICELAVCRCDGLSLTIDLSALPQNPEYFKGMFFLKRKERTKRTWRCIGGELGPEEEGPDGYITMPVLPERGTQVVTLLPI
jgi:hypothetical protein